MAAGNRTLTLPAANGRAGVATLKRGIPKQITRQNVPDAYTVMLQPGGSDTLVDGNITYTSIQIAPGETVFLCSDGVSIWYIQKRERSYRSRTRSVQPGDSSTIRTLAIGDRYISLEGASMGTFTLHLASDFNRTDFVAIRNNGTMNWTIAVTGSDLIYQTATGYTTLVITPGQSLPFFNRVAGSWEVPH